MDSDDTQEILRAIQGIDTRLGVIEDMVICTGMAMLDLLVAMKEDEKVRSQMRARVSDIKTGYEARFKELAAKAAS